MTPPVMTDDRTRSETQTNSKPNEETKTYPATDQGEHSTNAMLDNQKRIYTTKPVNIRSLSATLQLDRKKQDALRPSPNQGI